MSTKAGVVAKRVTKTGLVLAFAVLFLTPSLLTSQSYAQQRERPRNLMDMLFNGKRIEPKRPAVSVKNRTTSKKKKSSIVSLPAEPDAVVKLDTAKTVMVVGDFLAGGLAEGLIPAFDQDPNVKVIDRTRSSSGFVRDDVYNWPAEIKALIEAERPAAVVVMLGSNDRQQMRLTEERVAPLSEPWNKEYEARTKALAAAIAETRVPLLWVGMPSFKSSKMSQDMIAFNDFYKRAAEGAGGAYIDIWDGFVDEKGAFVTSGPDINGQPVRLRGSDGINLAKAGKRKVAFYVEKPLSKFIGGNTLPELDPLGPGAPPSAALPGGVSAIDRTLPVSLSDPDLDGGTELLGLKVVPKKADTESPGDRLAVEGIAPAAKPGRADDFGGAEDVPAPAVAAPKATLPMIELRPAVDAAAVPDKTTAISR